MCKFSLFGAKTHAKSSLWGAKIYKSEPFEAKMYKNGLLGEKHVQKVLLLGVKILESALSEAKTHTKVSCSEPKRVQKFPF